MTRFKAPEEPRKPTKRKREEPEYHRLLKRLPKEEEPPEKEPGSFSWYEITPKELRGWLHLCRYTIADAAKILKLHEGYLTGMLNGRARIPRKVSRMVRDFQKELKADKKWLERPVVGHEKRVWFLLKTLSNPMALQEAYNFGLPMDELMFYRFWTKKQIKARERILRRRVTGFVPRKTSIWDDVPLNQGVGCICAHRLTGIYAKADFFPTFRRNRNNAMRVLASMLGHRWEDHETIEREFEPTLVDVDEFMRGELAFLDEEDSVPGR